MSTAIYGPQVIKCAYLQAKTVYAVITLDPNELVYDMDRNTFQIAADVADYDPYVVLTEHAVAKGFYYRNFGKDFPDCSINVSYYVQAGGAPNTTTDLKIETQAILVQSQSFVVNA